MLTFF